MQEVSADLSIRVPDTMDDGNDAPSPPEYANNTRPDFVDAIVSRWEGSRKRSASI